jgi:hypothetical protein
MHGYRGDLHVQHGPMGPVIALSGIIQKNIVIIIIDIIIIIDMFIIIKRLLFVIK